MDSDQEEFEALMWALEQRLPEADDKLDAFLDRRFKEDQEAREIATRAGIVEEPIFFVVGGVTENPRTPEARRERRKNAPLYRVDSSGVLHPPA